MLRRSPTATADLVAGIEVATPPRSAERPPASESKIFQPSTYASRKAERMAEGGPAAPSRRLASLGTTEKSWRNQRTGQVEVMELELLFDVDHPVNRYFRVPGDSVVQPLNQDTGMTEVVAPLPPVGPRWHGAPGSSFPRSLPDPAPQPIT